MGRDTVSARISCIILAILSALLIAVSCFGIATSGLMKSNSFLSSRIINLDDKFIATVNEKLMYECDNMPVPAEAFASALDKETMDGVLTQAANNIILCYDMDFSDSRELYDCFYSGIDKYCDENNIKVSSDELNRCASFAVKITDKILSNGMPKQIKLFALISGKELATYFIYCLVGAVVFLIIINLVNKRRHKKYSYYALTLNTMGLIYIFGYILVNAKNYVGNFSFCNQGYFNFAIKDALNSIFRIFPIVGAVLLALGTVMIIQNYLYYRRKTKEMNETDEMNNKMKQEFIDHYSKKHR